MTTEKLKEKLQLLPGQPGVYLMKNHLGDILYIGKAKILKNRVRSYFTGSHDQKTQLLVSQIDDFEYVVTSSEREALLLEHNLIKNHTPPYNIMLKDDKSYPYLLITEEKHPRIFISRTPQKKIGSYYGPYPSATVARDAAKLLNRLLPFRKCNKIPEKACLYYHIGQCLGPCVKPVTEQQYQELLKKAQQFLKGNQQEIIRWLEGRMREAAENLQFEAAGEYRDLLSELQQIGEKQKITLNDQRDRDIVAFAHSEDLLSIQIFYYRQGKLIQHNHFLFPYYEPPEDAFISFLMQYYQENSAIPSEICVPPLEESSIMQLLPLTIPKRGKIAELVRLAATNAQTSLDEKILLETRKEEKRLAVLAELGVLLAIPPPQTIEVFDISGLAGTNVVGGMVQFTGGLPNRSAYRKFHLSHQEEAADDTAYMKEVVTRRYARLKEEKKEFPDLILVDGGKGQVRAALTALQALELSLDVAGLVKDDLHHTRGLINRQGHELPLSKDSGAFLFLEQMQEEVHRFAITFHRQQRLKKMTLSELDEIPGIGQKRRRLLFQSFQSIEELKKASIDQLKDIGLPQNIAKAVYEHFHPNTDIETV